jgi:hypothetical protein
MKDSDSLVYMEGIEFARESSKTTLSTRNGQPRFYTKSNHISKKVKNRVSKASKQFWAQ